MTKILIHMGALAEPISKQLKKQGFKLDRGTLAYFDRIKEALNTLRFNGLTTDSQYDQILKRATNYIFDKVEQWVEEQNKKRKVKS